jgi:hypothetical protein
MTNGYKVLVRKPEGKRPTGSSRRRWVYNIEMGLEEIGFESSSGPGQGPVTVSFCIQRGEFLN